LFEVWSDGRVRCSTKDVPCILVVILNLFTPRLPSRTLLPRERHKVKQEVIHLGEYETVEAALEAWPKETQKLRRMGRPKQAEKLQAKLYRLQELRKGG
jgi:hypothetical protein